MVQWNVKEDRVTLQLFLVPGCPDYHLIKIGVCSRRHAFFNLQSDIVRDQTT